VVLLQYLFRERINPGAPRRNGLGIKIGQGKKNYEEGRGIEARIRGRGSGGFGHPGAGGTGATCFIGNLLVPLGVFAN
jgi:hypothetical protein